MRREAPSYLASDCPREEPKQVWLFSVKVKFIFHDEIAPRGPLPPRGKLPQ